MQNREDIRQKGNDKELKKECHERGKIFRKRGLNMVFEPKYRTLLNG
jgi:hypothetical protein